MFVTLTSYNYRYEVGWELSNIDWRYLAVYDESEDLDWHLRTVGHAK